MAGGIWKSVQGGEGGIAVRERWHCCWGKVTLLLGKVTLLLGKGDIAVGER